MQSDTQSVRNRYIQRAPTDVLLCIPFLDTDTTQDELEADEELQRRGYPRLMIPLLRLLIAPGLWHQALMWEWIELDIADVFFGYGILIFVLGCLASLAGLVLLPFVPKLLPAAILLVLLGIALLGLGRFVANFRRRFEAKADQK